MTDVNSTTLRRWLAVWLPFLPADALRRLARERGEAGEKPDEALLVLTHKVKGAARVAAMGPAAAAAGVTAGAALADVRARLPDIVVADHDPFADARMLERLADDCERFSPVVAIDAPDGLVLDITGCAHLFGGEARLLAELRGRFRRYGFHARMTIAGAPDAARALARFGRIAIVPVGADEAETRLLPVAALGLPDDIRIALVRAGLKTLDDLASRPSLPLSARFGEDVARRLRRMFGQGANPVTPRRIAPSCIAERRFPEPVGRIEDIEATLADLMAELSDTLMQRREGGRRFEASFFRADGIVRRIAIETGQPTRDAKAVLRLYHERLEALADPVDPGFGFDVIRFAATETEPHAPAQASLDGRVQEEGDVADLVDRLSARFGRTRVLRFVGVDTHDPDRAARLAPAVEHRGDAPWPAPEPEEPPKRPLQLFASPQPVEVTAEVPDGPPRTFRWRRVEHRVMRWEGPERIAPEWWRDPSAPTRDYFRIEDEHGRRFWLFRAGLYERETDAPRWYVHGLFP